MHQESIISLLLDSRNFNTTIRNIEQSFPIEDILATGHHCASIHTQSDPHPCDLFIALAILHWSSPFLYTSSASVWRRVIRSCLEYGCFDVAIRLCDKYESAPVVGLTALDRSMNLWRARALRGLNEFGRAIEIYQETGRRDQNSGDQVGFAYTLMQIAKTFDNHEWRIGLALQLLELAIKKLHDCAGGHRQERGLRYLAITIDTKFGILAEKMRLQEFVNPLSADPDSFERDWSEALLVARKSRDGEAEHRMSLRQCNAAFFRSTSTERRTQIFSLFESSVQLLYSKPFQYRGLGVRLGQFGAMHYEMNNLSDALDHIYLACDYSEQVSDWRTLTKNYLRLATVLATQERRSDAVDMALFNARRALDKTGGTQPQLAFELNRNAAQIYGRLGNTRVAQTFLDEANSIVTKYRNRILSDLQETFPIPFANVDNKTFLEQPRWRISTILDEKTFSSACVDDLVTLSHLQQTLMRTIRTISLMESREREMSMYAMFLEHSRWLSPHRAKNVFLNLCRHAQNEISAVMEKISKDNNEAVAGLNATEIAFKKLEQTIGESFEEYSTRSLGVEHRWESVSDLVVRAQEEAAVNVSNMEQQVVRATCTGADAADFLINVSAPIFVYAIWALIDNGFKYGNATSANNTSVKVCVGWHHGGRMSPGYGRVRIVSEGNRGDALVAAWKQVENESDPSNRKSGLSFVYNLIQLYQGYARISFDEEEGTVFELNFPESTATRAV